MADRIKGITVAIGGDVSGLEKALTSANKEINKVGKELKDVERLLKLDPSNVELLAQKQKLLGTAIEQTKNKLDALRKAEKDAQKAFKDGKISEQQYNALKREIIDTEQKLGKLETQATETNSTIRKGAQKSETAVEGVEDAASKAKSAFNKLKSSASSALSKIESEADKAANATQGISTAAAALGGAMFATVGGTQELATDLSKLKINAEEANVPLEAVGEALAEIYAHSGQTDSAIEAISNLLQTGANALQLANAIDVLSGAVIRFPDTLTMESLADGLQETLATGEATGQYAELLERLGVDLEYFNAELAECATEYDKINFAIKILQEEGLRKTYEEWKKQNEALIENREANLELQESLSELGVLLAPILTMVTEMLTGLVDWFTGLDEGTQMAILGIIGFLAVLSPGLSMISTIVGMVSSIAGFLGGISITVLAVGAAIVAAIAVLAIWGDEIQGALTKIDEFFLKISSFDFTLIFGPVFGTLINSIVDLLAQLWAMFSGTLSGLIDFIRGVFTGDWTRAWQGLVSIGETIFNNLLAIARTPLNTIISLINGAINAANRLIDRINQITGWSIPSFGNFDIPMFANGGTLSSGEAIVGEAGPELLTVTNGVATVTPLNINVTNHNNFGNYNHAQGAAVSRDLALQINRELGRIY